MTHGDKAKAKTGKTSQASAKKVSSKAAEGGKAVAQGKGGQADKSPGKKQQAAGEKAASAAKKGGSVKTVPGTTASDAKGKNRAGASSAPAGSGGDGSGFSNAVVGAAFKRALKKYPNALRKLTD